MIDPKIQVQKLSPLFSQAAPQPEPQASVKQAPAAGVPETAVLEEDIRNYAYELYESRGGTEGHAEEDWLAAEAHLAVRRERN